MLYSANISMLFSGDIQKRLDQAKEFGFSVVEMWTPFAYDFQTLKAWKADHDIKFLMINTSPGSIDNGEWGTLCIPKGRDYFKEDFDKTVKAADELGCSMINVLVGKMTDGLGEREVASTLEENMTWALNHVPENLTLVIEALNKIDFPGSIFWKPDLALSFIKLFNTSKLKYLYDIFHASRHGLDIFQPIQDEIDEIKHIQIADCPGRNQPGTGAIDFRKFFTLVEQVNYKGAIGLEYKPVGNSVDYFSWMQNY